MFITISDNNVKVNSEKASEIVCTPGHVRRTDRQRNCRSHPLRSEGCGSALAAVIDLQKISVVE